MKAIGLDLLGLFDGNTIKAELPVLQLRPNVVPSVPTLNLPGVTTKSGCGKCRNKGGATVVTMPPANGGGSGADGPPITVTAAPAALAPNVIAKAPTNVTATTAGIPHWVYFVAALLLGM